MRKVIIISQKLRLTGKVRRNRLATYELNGRTNFIDNKLKEQLDRKVIPDLKKRDKDNVFLVDGGERIGKSVFTQSPAGYIASQLNTNCGLSNICMTPEEFRKKIENAKKNDVVIYDEAHRGMGSAGALSEINRILTDLMMEMGQKNLCVFIVMPTFFLLQKYTALFRSRGLFHIYERNNKRGYWVYFNQKNKLRLYKGGKKEFNYHCIKWPRFRGRFFNKYIVDEELYRKKKAESFKRSSADRKTKYEKYIKQRNRLLYGIYKDYGLSLEDLSKFCKVNDVQLKKTQISMIIAKFKGTS